MQTLHNQRTISTIVHFLFINMNREREREAPNRTQSIPIKIRFFNANKMIMKAILLLREFICTHWMYAYFFSIWFLFCFVWFGFGGFFSLAICGLVCVCVHQATCLRLNFIYRHTHTIQNHLFSPNFT